jgi:hypothetical protein
MYLKATGVKEKLPVNILSCGIEGSNLGNSSGISIITSTITYLSDLIPGFFKQASTPDRRLLFQAEPPSINRTSWPY